MKIVRSLIVTFVIVGLCTLCGTTRGNAQDAPSADALQAAKELVSLTSTSMIFDMTNKTTDQLWPSVEAALRAANPNIDAATLAELRQKFVQLVMNGVSESLKDAPPFYARHFTAQEMRDLYAFYRTPLGTKSLRVMPIVSFEFLSSLGPRMQNLDEKVNLAFLNILQERGYYAK
jgi:uncharacterized protein